MFLTLINEATQSKKTNINLNNPANANAADVTIEQYLIEEE